MEPREQREEGPYQEPENSTVDDWHGQKLARQQEQADQAVEDADGDLDKAEDKFDDGAK